MAQRKKKKTVSAMAYNRLLKKLSKSSGRGKQALRKKAASARSRMIGRNGKHHEVESEFDYPKDLSSRMPKTYRALFQKYAKTAQGKKGLARFKKFWGVPLPPQIRAMDLDGTKKTTVLVGMGDSPEVHLSATPKGKGGSRRRVAGKWIAATDVNGRRIMLLSGKKIRGRMKFVGYAPETHYIPSADIERAGTKKRGKHWRHLHDDEGGKWPKVYADRDGKVDKDTNFIYATGTYRVTDWIRR